MPEMHVIGIRDAACRCGSHGIRRTTPYSWNCAECNELVLVMAPPSDLKHLCTFTGMPVLVSSGIKVTYIREPREGLMFQAIKDAWVRIGDHDHHLAGGQTMIFTTSDARREHQRLVAQEKG